MKQSELQANHGSTSLSKEQGTISLHKELKEKMPALMSVIEATDTKGPPILSLNGKSETDPRFKFVALKKALMDPAYRQQALDEMLTDLLVAAYRDRFALMMVRPTAKHEADVGTLQSIQKMRQSADIHLMKMLALARDMERPKTNITVNRAQQVNVADKQVNVAQEPR